MASRELERRATELAKTAEAAARVLRETADGILTTREGDDSIDHLAGKCRVQAGLLETEARKLYDALNEKDVYDETDEKEEGK